MNAKKNRNQSTNEFGKLSDKSTGIFTIELIQNTEIIDIKENNALISRLNFFDLPGSEILLEDPENIRIKQGPNLNKGILSVANCIKDIS